MHPHGSWLTHGLGAVLGAALGAALLCAALLAAFWPAPMALAVPLPAPGAPEGADAGLLEPATAPVPGSVPGDESWWDGFDAQGTDGEVLAFSLFAGELVAGGQFTMAGATSAAHIARWDGDSWSPLGQGTNGAVRCLAVYNGGLVAGGQFTLAGGAGAGNIARWDGTSWSPLGLGTNGEVLALAVFNGVLVAGGAFTLAGGSPASHIAAWNGTGWIPLGAGVNGDVHALTVYGGEVIAGGAFTLSGIVPLLRIGRWDGSSWSAYGSGANDNVHSLAITSHLWVGGKFTSIDGVPAERIARWNGMSWSALGSGLIGAAGASVNAMVVYTGKLTVGGRFDFAGAGPAENIAAWDFSTTWNALGSGLTGGALPETRALAVYKGSLYAGGSFQVAGGHVARYMARWTDPVTFNAQGVTLESLRAPHELSPGASLGNDVWGYVSTSAREYAMIGLTNGVAFVEVTDPQNPVHIGTVPHTSSVWADVRPYDQYAYIVADATVEGMQIVDLTQIDSGSITLLGSFHGNGVQRAHTIGVNPESGHVYLFGSNVASGGIVAVDVSIPTVPLFAGSWAGHYVHDAQVVTYSSGPYAGREIAFAATTSAGLTIVDVTDKSNMFTVSTLAYPNATYCHQCWLSADRRYLFIDDELDHQAGVLFTTTYVVDVSDITNPQLVTTFTNGLRAVDHDLMVRGTQVFEANYSSGLRVFDASDIGNIHEVAYFDTYPEDDEPSFNGAWGPYTDLPSGTVLVSDRQRGLFVLRMTTGVGVAGDPRPAPITWTLSANHPNPFHPRTAIGFELARPAPIRLTIFTALGRQVCTLLDSPLSAGRHAVIWDGRDEAGIRMPGGVYWYRLDNPRGSEARRMVLVH